jgi:two-component system, OmpR family, response regulator
MPRKLILLEDEPEIRSLLTDILEQEGFAVSTAGSIAQFHDMNERDSADLYLIDMGLPDGSGIPVLRHLAQNTSAGVIVLSARSEETDKVIGLELGADDFITKPFRRRELLARINAVLRRVGGGTWPGVPPAEAARSDAGRRDAAGETAFDGYRVRLSSRQVFAPDGSEVDLTTAEFDLLAAFLKRREQTLSRERLITLMKGREWDAHDRMIDGLVSRLRRKLPPQGERTKPYIRTVHGFGYAFSD